LFRVPETGGQAAVATRLEPGQNDHRAPIILPDGQHFIYYARGNPQVRGVHVARLDGTEAQRLLDADGAAVYARSGHLLFPRQGELLAQSFDVTRLALVGEAFRVADSVSVNPGISLASLPPHQRDQSRTAPIAFVERNLPGSIGLAGGSRRLVHRTREAWPIPRSRPTVAGSPSAALSVETGTCG
jgi:hypothetical protein